MHNPPKRILLAGATGYIGRAVARRLAEAGYPVVAPVRDGSVDMPPGCEPIVADITDATSFETALADRQFDVVVSCIASRSGAPDDTWRVDYQANQNLLDAATRSGAGHFILLSAICVQRPKLAFQHAKLAFEAALIGSGIDYTVVRPTAFFKSLSGQVERVRAGKPFLLFGDGTQTACKPISEQDLADYLIACIADADRRNRILPVGGPGDAITPREQGDMLFELTGQPPRFRQIPPGMFKLASGVLGPLGKLSTTIAAKAEFARIGYYYATESMLVWDDSEGRYDADATPSTGTMTLREHYRQVLDRGLDGHEAGDHKLF